MLISITGELGLGPDEPKSATKPTKHQPLTGIEVLQYVEFIVHILSITQSPFRVAAGQNTTFFLVKPNEKYSDLPRHPIEMEPPELCVECNQDTGNDDSLLECEKVVTLLSILRGTILMIDRQNSATILIIWRA